MKLVQDNDWPDLLADPTRVQKFTVVIHHPAKKSIAEKHVSGKIYQLLKDGHRIFNCEQIWQKGSNGGLALQTVRWVAYK